MQMKSLFYLGAKAELGRSLGKMRAYAAVLCAAGLPPGERRIPRGLSHDGDTFMSAGSRLGSCSPQLKQALAEILVPLDPPPSS